MRRQRLTTQERSDLRALGVTVKVLARATTATGPVIALPGHLVWQTGQGWDQVAWHDIVRGSWQPASNRLGWWDGTGQAHGLDLVEPGSLPGVFREQIDSTILVEELLGPRELGVVVTVQRRLDRSGQELVFHRLPVNPEQPVDPALWAAAGQRLEDFRRDFDD